MLAQEKADKIYLTGVILMVIALPLSMFLMSVSQFVILGSWLLSGNILRKLKSAFSNKLVLVATGIYFLHIIGLLWTSDFNYALKDLRIKLPLLALPIIFSTSVKFSNEHFKLILKFFIAATFVSTCISFAVYLGLTSKKINDIREISIFISHIRLSLLVCMAVFALVWLWTNNNKSHIQNFAGVVLIIWFLIFLALLESVTGLGILFFVAMVFVYGKLIMQKKYVFLAVITPALFGSVFFVFRYCTSIYKNVITINEPKLLSENTINGNPYTHFPERFDSENGYKVYNNICEAELEPAWNNKSKMSYSGTDKKGNELRQTLFRYLTSLNLKKDSAGISQITDNDVAAIENGIPNKLYITENSIYTRLHTIAWEINYYKHGSNPSGHSVTMRFEFWKAGLFIIKKHLWKGVGTGDVPLAFKRAYKRINSPLSEQWQLRTHNQFLTVALALGIFGLAYFIFSLIAPVYFSPNGKTFLYLSFLFTAILSMLTEDTLETQAGVTFFAFFNALYLWGFNSQPSLHHLSHRE